MPAPRIPGTPFVPSAAFPFLPVVVPHVLSHRVTGRFSPLVLDYLEAPEKLSSFYGPYASDGGMAEALKNREAFPTDREILSRVLHQQYEGLDTHEAVRENIEKLRLAETFTICTAHQPALLTGAWYFVYKILHTVKLAAHLKAQFPEKHFVPVFYIGSEDNDLEELGHFHYQGTRYDWDGAGQTGAVGRMKTEGLQAVLQALFKRLGPPGEHTDALKAMLEDAYRPGETIAGATRRLVNSLMGRYGVVVLDGDHPDLKRQMQQAFYDDLFNHRPFETVTRQTEKLQAGYKTQAYPRSVNLFYLKDGIRERIEQQGQQWQVLNTDIVFTQPELEAELKAYPERFSPNVVLRGLYQETLLPNIAFIGGGAEVAYWMQLKTLFESYGVPYPTLVLRQSFQWIDARQMKRLQQLDLSVEAVFESPDALVRKRTEAQRQIPFDSAALESILMATLEPVATQAAETDASLQGFMEAEMHRFRKRAQRIGQKIFRAEKRRHSDWENRLRTLQEQLFPGGGLQERKGTFLDAWPDYGPALLDCLLEYTCPYGDSFVVLEEKSDAQAESEISG